VLDHEGILVGGEAELGRFSVHQFLRSKLFFAPSWFAPSAKSIWSALAGKVQPQQPALRSDQDALRCSSSTTSRSRPAA
jgi:hypothetical protein